MKIISITLKALSLVVGFCLIICPQPSLAQNTRTILLLPFAVQADPMYAYLRPALADMLFTRLSAPGRTIVVDESKATSGMPRADAPSVADAVKIGRQRGADYVVTGRIRLEEDGAGTRAEFIGIDEQKALIAFDRQGTQPGDIISQIDNFTAQVNADIFSPGASSNEPAPQDEATDDIYKHPEKMTIPEIPPDGAAENKPRDGQPSRTGLQPRDNR